jgi:hypothetical protein
MTVFGELEGLIDDLYPYRVVLASGALLALAALLWVGYRRGWHLAIDRHRRVSVVVAALALAVLVPLGGYTFSPLWTRSELNEASPLVAAGAPGAAATAGAGDVSGPPTAPTVVAAGEFAGADEFHFAEGRVRVIETGPGRHLVRFEGFSIRNGPDLYVYLSPEADGYDEAGSLELGPLKATDGAFNYEVPAGADLAPYRSVVVWCRPFAVLFATAPLVPA